MIFDVDVQGGLKLKQYFGDKALAVFVKVPSLELLEERLRDRDTDSEDAISRRIFKAKFEMSFEDRFDVTLVNEELDTSLEKAERLMNDFFDHGTITV